MGDSASGGEEGAAPRSFGHRLALDGVRGFAVALVVLFHGGFTALKGGYLGVSVFFTLSGFLITSLALVEFATHGRIAIGSFWLRRLKRLVPALLVALALAVLAVALIGDDTTRRNLFGDVLGGLTYTENWHWIFANRSYGDLFTTPSPLLHLWSLSVEEQFYVVFPLLAALVLRWGRWALGGLAAAVVVGSAVVPTILGWSLDRSYYGTDVRAGEIAIGVVAAVLLFGRSTVTGRNARRTVSAISTIGLVGILVACLTLPQSWIGWKHGGFAAFALVSVLVVAAAALDVGPVAAMGRTRVLRRLGKVSYGLYLYHWIVLWFLREATDWSAPWRFIVGIGVSYALAEASLFVLEDPIRTGVWPWADRVDALSGRPWNARRGARLAVVATVLVGVVVAGSVWTGSGAAPAVDFEAMQRRLTSRARGSTSPSDATTIAMFGDSTATMTGVGMAAALDTTSWGDRFVLTEGDTKLGCGILLPDMNRGVDGREYELGQSCRALANDWQVAIDSRDPDIAVLETARWETWDMRIPGVDGWHGLGEPVFDAWATARLRTIVDILGSRGATVVLLTPPSESRADLLGARATDERLQRWTAILRDVANGNTSSVVVVDLGAWHAAQGSRDVTMRRDGIHVDVDSGRMVADEFLLPALADIVDRQGQGVPA